SPSGSSVGGAPASVGPSGLYSGGGRNVRNSKISRSTDLARSTRCRMKVSRRDLLAGAAGVVALGAAAATEAQETPADPTKVRGRPSRALGQRAASEKPLRQPRGATSSGTPHQDLYGTITPSDLHFERHHAGVPEIDPKSYSLLIHGMVERPTMFTLADLKRFPAVSRVHFLECSGNFGGRGAATDLTPQQIAGLT